MPGPYPEALRKRIAEAYLAGEESCPAIAERFQVSVATVERLGRRAREGAGLEPAFSPGRPPKMTKADRRWVERQLTKNPYITSYELTELFCDSHPEKSVHRSTILRVMKGLGWTSKKRPRSRRSETVKM